MRRPDSNEINQMDGTRKFSLSRRPL